MVATIPLLVLGIAIALTGCFTGFAPATIMGSVIALLMAYEAGREAGRRCPHS